MTADELKTLIAEAEQNKLNAMGQANFQAGMAVAFQIVMDKMHAPAPLTTADTNQDTKD